MASGPVRVQSGDVISATLMNYILEQLEELTGGAPADIEQLKKKIQDLESWRSLSDPQINKITDLLVRLSSVETSLGGVEGLADKVDNLEDDYAALLARVATLESRLQVAGKVRISGFDPPDMIPVGQVLTILGSGFKTSTVEGRLSLVENLVFVNDTPIYNFRLDSDASRLNVVIPTNIPGVTPTAGGTTVTIRVGNTEGEAQRPYKVTPALPVTGTPPRITRIRGLDTQTPDILTGGMTAVIEGVGLGISGNPTQANNQVPSVTVIYRAPTGPVSYIVPQQQISFDQWWLVNSPVRFTVPYIIEAPATGTFEAMLRVGFGNHVPAIARVTIARGTPPPL